MASGSFRDVFSHPEDADLLIKVVRPAVAETWHKTISWWERPFRRFKYYIYFLRDVQEHIAARLADGQRPKLIQTIVGFVDTDLGLGLVAQIERNRAGELAPTLCQLVQTGAFDDRARKAFEAFTESLLSSDVIVGDLTAHNLVYSYDETNAEHFVIIDGLGEKNWIPINSLSPFFSRRCKRRKISKIRAFIQSELQQPNRASINATSS